MVSHLLYQQEPTKLEFDANVVAVFDLLNGHSGVVLDETYFYPTGGGQEHDNGTIGTARVVDVYKDEENDRLVHVVEGQVEGGLVHAQVDADRRLRHMQHHTAQHLLTQCILRQVGFETVSANINGYTPSTLDLVAPQISKSDLDQAELMANRVIYEDRQVKTYFVTPEELLSIPLRRPPKVNENIRIVEIDGYDYSPCGGTHVLRTGSIGLVKVVKVEKQNDKQRVYFIAGSQAIDVFHNMFDAFAGLANRLSMAWQDIPGFVDKQSEGLASLQKELVTLRRSSVKYETRELMDAAVDRAGIKLIHSAYENRPVAELRILAEELKKIPACVAYLASFDGQKVSLVVTCGESSGMDAKHLLNDLLSRINGRGGGDIRQAQGGGVATKEQYSKFFEDITLS